MLRGIHKASSTWLGKGLMAAVMGFLVLSFAIWGIGDIFRGFGRNSAITVGGTEISVEQLRQYYNDQLRQLSNRARRPITPDQARAMGLDRQLIAQLIAETTLDEQAKVLNLAVSNTEIANRITADPSFKGVSGQFDRQRFEELIREAGFTEGAFVERQRRAMLRRQVALSIAGDVNVPNVALAAIERFRDEQRSIDYVALGPAQAGDIAAPSADTLKAYFNDHKAAFRAPEYRKVTLLSLSPSDIAKPDEVSEADAKKYYDEHKAQFGTPEKREVRQIIFPDPEDAAAARQKIAKGESFDDLVKERGLKPSDTDLGMVPKAGIIDPAIADAAFSIKPGEVSQPIKGSFGTVLLTVGKIEPGTQKSFAEVEPQIKREIAEGRARAQIGDLRDKVEDERAAGSTLAEAGKKLGLKPIVVEAIDRAGNGPDGKPVANLPKLPNLVQAIFATDVGVDNEALQLPNGGFLYYDVTGVTPSRERNLDEVKSEVEKRWRDEEVAKRLMAKSTDLLSKLKAGTSLADVASSVGAKVEHASGLSRANPGTLPENVVAAVFRTGKDQAATASGKQPTEQYVFRVTDVSDPKLDPNSAESKSLAATLQSSYVDDISAEYIARLEADFGVDVNQSAISQVVGGGNP
jgi:peptidyl-prolyl cis-trans isomerase D